MLKPAVLKSARSARLLRLAGCAAAAAGLVMAAVPAAEAGSYAVTLSCSSFAAPAPAQVQCYGYSSGGNGTYYTAWTVSGDTSIYEENFWALSFYCTSGNAVNVTVTIHDSAGEYGRASWSGTCA